MNTIKKYLDRDSASIVADYYFDDYKQLMNHVIVFIPYVRKCEECKKLVRVTLQHPPQWNDCSRECDKCIFNRYMNENIIRRRIFKHP